MAAVRSHSLSIGIVGLPNAGKSTLFNSLTKNSIPAENFPFTTIDKNVGVVQIPDPRLDKLEAHYSAEKKVPSAMTYVDIAGLVKGASKGEGLGNQFLSHIREVDVVMYVLRAFSSEKIVHVYNRVDPYDDFEIVRAELILKDLETVEKKLAEAKGMIRPGENKELEEKIKLFEQVYSLLSQGKPASDTKVDGDQRVLFDDLWLLTSKPVMYVLNIREGTEDLEMEKRIEGFKGKVGKDEIVVAADVKLIGELSDMNEEEKKGYLELLPGTPTLIEDIIMAGYRRLNLLTFYTGNEKEVNAWTIGMGATIKEAAGVIHTDLGEGFITADVVNVVKMIEAGGWVAAKEKGIVRNQSKEYLIQDGDYINVLAN
jgi:GTP-binding protein YchF